MAHMACFQMGAVAMPLSILFGPDALEYRLQNSEAMVAIVDRAALDNLQPIRASCPALKHVIARRLPPAGSLDWDDLMAQASPDSPIEATPRLRSGDPDLHQRHHRRAERRADAACGGDRQPARLRRLARLVSASKATCSGRRPTGPGPAA